MLRFLFVALTLAVACPAQDVARLNQVVEAYAADQRFMGAALVAKDGTVLLNRAYGSANLEWKIPNTTTTKFRIGSVTKQFTAAAILLLEERGRLKVDDAVAKHVEKTPPAWEKITIFHLLTHTSGIPSITGFSEFNTWKLSPSTPAQNVERFRDRALDFQPGEKHVYSNSGYILLGHIIERVSGQSYESFMRENVFQPLGMEDTGYDSNLTVIPQRAAGYTPGAEGPLNAPYVDMTFPHAAGALYSTTPDLLRWTEGLFGGKLISPASLEKMITPHLNNYAFGVGVRTTDGRKVIEHGGGIEGFNSYLAYYPEQKLTVAVLANINGGAPTQIAGQLAAVALGDEVTLPSERRTTQVPVATLQNYVGVYQLAPRITNTIRLTDGQLTTQLSGQPAFPIFPETDAKFFLKVVDAQVEFFKDDTGKVTHLMQYQNGRAQKAPRISDTVIERKAVDVPLATLQRYVGTYTLQPGVEISVTLEGGQLTSQLTGQKRFPIFAESETSFFFKIVDAQLEFSADEQGVVTHVTLHQGGRDIKAPRK